MAEAGAWAGVGVLLAIGGIIAIAIAVIWWLI